MAKTDISLQEFISQLAAGWRLIDGPHGWLDALGGFRFWYVGRQSSLQANQAAIDEASTNLVNLFAEQLTTPNSNLRNLIQQRLNLDALQGRSPSLPVPPLADRELRTIVDNIEHRWQKHGFESRTRCQSPSCSPQAVAGYRKDRSPRQFIWPLLGSSIPPADC